MGVEHTQPEKGRKLVIDIGGGSTELVIGEDFEPKLVESRRMGCVSFAQMYFPGGGINGENFRRARMAATQKLESLAWQFRIQGWNVALGASGSIKAAHEVLSFLRRERWHYHPGTSGKTGRWKCWKYKNFAELSLPRAFRRAQSGVCAGHRRFCVAYSMRWLSASCACPMVRCVKAFCMRWKAVSATEDIRSRTAQSLASQYNIDREQARRVLETTTLMYDQWQAQNPKLANPQLAALLKWAAMLHEVGLNINHSGMHRHSAYILQNSDLHRL